MGLPVQLLLELQLHYKAIVNTLLMVWACFPLLQTEWLGQIWEMSPMGSVGICSCFIDLKLEWALGDRHTHHSIKADRFEEPALSTVDLGQALLTTIKLASHGHVSAVQTGHHLTSCLLLEGRSSIGREASLGWRWKMTVAMSFLCPPLSTTGKQPGFFPVIL